MKGACSRLISRFMAMCVAASIFVGIPVVEVKAAVQTSFYVDPVNGDDSNDGTSIGSAFKTIDKARQVVASTKGSMWGDIEVNLRGGTHVLNSTLTFNESDSGNNGHYVIYKAYNNEVPVITGGRELAGNWTLYDASKNIYSKNVGSLEFRELYVNDSMAIRARMPNKNNNDTLGAYYSVVQADCTNKKIKIRKSEISNWSGLTRVEMVMEPHWYHYRGRISSYTTDANYAYVSFQTPEADSIFLKGNNFWTTTAYFFENSYDFIDAEGEWFLDVDTDTLYYKPRAGENMESVSLIAPTIDKLIDITGTSANKVQNIQFEGLTFKHAGWNGPNSSGAAMTQGARSVIPGGNPLMGAITVQYANGIDFKTCIFKFMALNAISFVKGVSSSAIYNCEFSYIGGNAIVNQDSGTMNPASADACDDIKILNNYITRVGQTYSNGIGIVSYFVKRLLAEHNEICYTPYMGMQTGGQAGDNIDVGMKDNIIRHNKIHHVMQLHDDGGAIYNLSRQSGTYIFENYNYNIYRSGLTGTFAVAGVYLDNYSEFITVEHNSNTNNTAPIYEQTGIGARNNKLINNVTTAETSIANYAGRNTGSYIWPSKVEAENMDLTNYTVESSTAYSNDSGVKANAGTTGIATTNFTGSDGTYSIDVAYLAEDDGNAIYRLYVNDIQVDSWTAAAAPAATGMQIRHRVKHDISIKNGQQIKVEGVQTSGSEARIDYIGFYGRSIDTSTPTPNTINYALNGTVTASSTYGTGYEATRAIDDDTVNGGWKAANTSVPQWLSIDLGTTRSVNKFVLYLASNPNYTIKDYIIQGSSNGTDFTDIVAVTNNSSLTRTHDVSDQSYRYFRLYITGVNSGDYIARCMELQIIGNAAPANYALNGTVTASSTYGTGYEATKAIDDDTVNGGWKAANTSVLQWLSIDLGTTRSVNKFVLYLASNPNYTIKDYIIQGSSNGTDFTDIVAVTNNSSLTRTHDVSDQSYRYFRLYITGVNSGDYIARCMEFQIWG